LSPLPSDLRVVFFNPSNASFLFLLIIILGKAKAAKAHKHLL